MNYYVIILIHDLTSDMIKESYSDIYQTNKIDSTMYNTFINGLRIITDTSVTPNLDYAILKFKNKFPLTMAGYKKYSIQEIQDELNKPDWKHNQV